MKVWRHGIIAGLAAVLSAAPPAAAADATRQTATASFTTEQPGAATGTAASIEWRNPDTPGAKPPALKTLIVRYPAGTVIDTSAPVQCKASDAELYMQGTAACPPESKVGEGTFTADEGVNPVTPRFITYKLTLFNNEGEVIQVADQIDPPQQPGFRNVGRGKIEGSTVTNDIPALPSSLDANNPYTALAQMQFGGDPIVRDGKAYMRTPPTCSASRTWMQEFTFVYQDGVTQNVDVPLPCRRARHT